jgi:hypothetical protein
VEVTDQCWIKLSNRFAALENLNENVDIDVAWESVCENGVRDGLDYYVQAA